MRNRRFPISDLGPLCTKIGSGATPRGGDKVYLDRGDIALIRSQNVHNNGFNREGLVYIAEEHAEQLSNVTVESEDVLLNITGDSVARCCQVDPGVLPARVNQHVAIIRPNHEVLNPRFLRYFLVSPTMQSEMLAWSHAGATRKALTKGMIESFKVPVPPLPVQRRIAHILGTLDDKIELNRQMNRTLEKMAAAIFKSWFIDFDPVHAKAEGRDTGLPDDITDLFPDAFEESDLGPIPRGWEAKPLAATVKLLSGGTPKTSEPSYWNGGIPWFSVKDAPADSDVWVVATERTLTQAGIDNSAAQLLPSRTTIISARGTVGRLALTGVPMAMNQSCYGIKGIDGYGDYFTYYLIRSSIERLQQNTHGTVFDTITRKTFETLQQVTPSSRLAIKFDEATAPLLERMCSNLLQSMMLARLRDTLLPKILSDGIGVFT